MPDEVVINITIRFNAGGRPERLRLTITDPNEAVIRSATRDFITRIVGAHAVDGVEVEVKPIQGD